MEEKLLEIIERDVEQIGWDEQGNPIYNGFQHKAKEIADHFKEFIKWKDFWADYDNHDTTYYLDSIDKYLTLDELYQYWLTNIYKK